METATHHSAEYRRGGAKLLISNNEKQAWPFSLLELPKPGHGSGVNALLIRLPKTNDQAAVRRFFACSTKPLSVVISNRSSKSPQASILYPLLRVPRTSNTSCTCVAPEQ